MTAPEARGPVATGAALAAAALLAGCAGLPLPAARPPTAPDLPPAAAAPTAPPAPAAAAAAMRDPDSAALAAFYGRIEAERRARGLMRTDDGRRDGPVSASRLAAIWTDVALRDEPPAGGPPMGASPLRRWERPVVYRLEFGPSVPASVQASDRARVAGLVAQMSAAARHPMRLAAPGEAAGNFHVLVLSEAERRGSAARLRALVPGIDEAAVALVVDLPRETFCIVLSFARDGGAALTEAVAVIRAEHPDLTRLACYHEELAQGLGLAADSPRARPSVFNDDQEFALLTGLDLLLLRLHYDPRLRTGMTEREAAPIALAIAAELAAGES